MPERDDAETVLFYAPRTRSFTAVWMLEELGDAIDYRLDSFLITSGRQRSEAYLAKNPMGKVPVLRHRGRHVSELGAIAIYLADLFPQAELAPAIDHGDRPEYLRWCFFSSAIFEPALAQKFFKWEVDSGTVAWGSFERMQAALLAGLKEGPYVLGDRFSMADVLVGASVRFGQQFGALDKTGVLGDYAERTQTRPAYERAAAIEAREGEKIPPSANK